MPEDDLSPLDQPLTRAERRALESHLTKTWKLDLLRKPKTAKEIEIGEQITRQVQAEIAMDEYKRRTKK